METSAPIRPVAVYGTVNEPGNETKGPSTISIGSISLNRASEQNQSNKSIVLNKNTSSHPVNLTNNGVGHGVGNGVGSGVGNGVGGNVGGDVVGSVGAVGGGESAFRPRIGSGKKYPQLGQGPLTRKYSESEDEGEHDEGRRAPGKFTRHGRK